jgi:hypothetical protein
VSFPRRLHDPELHLELERAISSLSPSHSPLHLISPKLGVATAEESELQFVPLKLIPGQVGIQVSARAFSFTFLVTASTLSPLPMACHRVAPAARPPGLLAAVSKVLPSRARPFSHPHMHYNHYTHTKARLGVSRGSGHLTALPHPPRRASTATVDPLFRH